MNYRVTVTMRSTWWESNPHGDVRTEWLKRELRDYARMFVSVQIVAGYWGQR